MITLLPIRIFPFYAMSTGQPDMRLGSITESGNRCAERGDFSWMSR